MSARATCTVFFEPGDLLLFRDHRPFDMGSHVLALGRFPASSVFFGCLRTALVQALDPAYFDRRRTATEVEQTLAAVDPWIRGPFAARRDPSEPSGVSLRLPSPRDVPGLSSATGPSDRLRPVATPRGRWFDRVALLDGTASHTAPAIPLRAGKLPTHPEPHLLTPAGLDEWRAASSSQVPARTGSRPNPPLAESRAAIYVDEARVGIARDDHRLSVIEGMFYIAVYTRLATGCGYAIEVSVDAAGLSTLTALDGRVVRLGGDSRGARITVIPHPLLPAAWGTVPGDRARILLLTPARASVLRAGRLTLPGGQTARVESLVTDTDALPAGGYDFALGAPKPLDAMLPQGTVFFCHFDASAPGALRHVGDIPDDHRAGFGVVACGEW